MTEDVPAFLTVGKTAQPVPQAAGVTKYQRREIGEGNWQDCTEPQFQCARSSPEWDTRIIVPSPKWTLDDVKKDLYDKKMLTPETEEAVEYLFYTGQIATLPSEPVLSEQAALGVVVPRELIEQLWTDAQEIAYHAEMDTVKGKRRGHWILPKAKELIAAVEPYREAALQNAASQGGENG